MIALTLSAVPAQRKTITHTQSDGTLLTLMLVGDEHLHYYINTATNEKMLQGDDGDFHILAETKLETMKQAASVRMKAANEARLKRLNAHRVQNVATNGPRRVGQTSGSMTGNKKGLVILVNFSDVAMADGHTQSAFDDQFNKEDYSEGGHIGSVHDYFYDQSYGQFDLTFDVVGPVTVSKEMSYYGSNDSSGSDKYPATMVSEALKLVDDDVNFADYDWDGDGEVEQVFVIYAGYGEAYGASSNTIWPHEWDLTSAGVGAQTLDGVKINTYACTCELSGTSGTTLSGIGTACHEFSHCLGYPDFYDTDYSGGLGMGFFDIMNSGSYNGPQGCGEVPSGYTSYERWMAGWLTPTELNDPATITNMPALNDSPTAYVIYNQGNTNEYFLVENRQNKDWFYYLSAGSAGNGLFITHVDYNATAWSNNTPNDSPTHQRMTWIAADGTQAYSYLDDLWGDYFPGTSNVTSLTNTSHTDAGAKLFNANTDGSYCMNHELTEITRADNGTVSFLFDQSRYTVTYNKGTGTCATESWIQTDFRETTTLPTATPPSTDWEFVGWSTTEYAKESSTAPTTLLKAGDTYQPKADVTLYAVYKMTETGSSANGSYTLDYSAETNLQSTTLGYGNAVTYTATDGSTWIVKAYKSKGMQINKERNASIKVPECPSNISTIEVTDNTAKVLSFSATDYTGSNSPTAAATSASATSTTLDLTSANLNTGYIYTTDGATTITKIVVNYGEGSTYTYYTYPSDAVLTTPTITFAQDNQTIYIGDNPKTIAATVTGSTGAVTYSSTDTKIATVDASSGAVSPVAVGSTTITAKVAAVSGVSRSAKTTYTLDVKMPALESIAVTTQPTTTTYTEGETFKTDGMVVTATYANGYTQDVTDYTYSPNAALTTTDNTITISYNEGDVIKTTTINITINPLPKYTVTFNAGTGSCTTESLTEESYQSGVTLPTATAVSDEWTFAGWTTDNVAETEIKPETVLAADATYKPEADVTLYAVYKMTVGGDGDYKLVESAPDDWSGDYLVAYSSTIFADGRVGGTEGIGKSLTRVSPGTYLNGNTISAEWGDNYNITLETITDGYVMKTKDGQYNYHTGSESGISSTTYIKTASAYPITVTFNSSSDIDIICNNMTFHYNTNGFFRFYKNGGQENVYLYKKENGTSYYATSPASSTDVKISSVCYATYYNSKHAYKMPTGVKGYIAYYDEDWKFKVAYNEGDVVPADEGLILEGNTDTYTFEFVKSDAKKMSENCLLGTDEATALAEDNNYYFYALQQNKEGTSVGMYWMEEDGAAFTNGAHKAYMKIAKSSFTTSGAKKSGFSFDVATAIHDIITDKNSEGKTYNLNGQQIDTTINGHVYIRNGKKFIAK